MQPAGDAFFMGKHENHASIQGLGKKNQLDDTGQHGECRHTNHSPQLTLGSVPELTHLVTKISKPLVHRLLHHANRFHQDRQILPHTMQFVL